MSIKNYTSQTNSHEGYTIEELRRLFGDGKQITSENLIKLINQCFNYELVSGNGIRIIELKNNDYRNNTTKTYKLECTCKGGGGGSGSGADIDTDKGITFDTDGSTVIADLYDYEESGNPDQEGVFPVSLSEDGKLIVDMTTSDINIEPRRAFTYHIFENKILQNVFWFDVSIEGSKLYVYKIETWIEDNGQIVDKETYDDVNNPQVIEDLNSLKTARLYKNCSAKINEANVNAAVTRTGKIKVYYKIKNTLYDETKSTWVKFMHQIYYGYTCDYNATDASHIAPERYEEDPNRTTQPCFKVYSKFDNDYDNGNHLTGKRLGLELKKSGNEYDLIIPNTEKDPQGTIKYVLGYYDMSSSQEGKHTLSYLPTSKTFHMTGLASHGEESVFVSFFIPKSMTEITNMTSSIDEGQPWPILNGMLVEHALVNDYTYHNNNSQYIEGVEYIVYTQKSSFITEVTSNIDIECTVSTL